jgi:hypothetical protein
MEIDLEKLYKSCTDEQLERMVENMLDQIKNISAELTRRGVK